MTVSPMERSAAMTEAILDMNRWITLSAAWADMVKPSAVLGLKPADEAFDWCQGCNRIIERTYMRWLDEKYRCLTCINGTQVPDSDYPGKQGPIPAPAMECRGVMRTNRGVFRRWQDPITGSWYRERQPLVGVESWDN